MKTVTEKSKKNSCNRSLEETQRIKEERYQRRAKMLELKKQREKAKRIRRAINEKWENLEHDFRYKKASVRTLSICRTKSMQRELFEDNTLVLSMRHMIKSTKEQDRILRRIVEKRQAQMVHRKGGRVENLSSSYLSTRCVSISMKAIFGKRNVG